MYSLKLHRIKSLAKGQLNKRSWEGSECSIFPVLKRWENCIMWMNRWGGFVLPHITWATSKCNSPRFSCLSALSLILQLLVSLLVESKACLSLVSKCRKNSNNMAQTILTHTDFVFLIKSIQHGATLPSPGCLYSLLWLFPTQTVLQRVPNL